MTEHDCQNIIEATGKKCGADPGRPFDARFCSPECADKVNAQELAELGITPELMKQSLEQYYACKDEIDKRLLEPTSEPVSDRLAESDQPQEHPSP